MTTRAQRAAQRKFIKMAKARAKAQRKIRIKRLTAELKRLRRRK